MGCRGERGGGVKITSMFWGKSLLVNHAKLNLSSKIRFKIHHNYNQTFWMSPTSPIFVSQFQFLGNFLALNKCYLAKKKMMVLQTEISYWRLTHMCTVVSWWVDPVVFIRKKPVSPVQCKLSPVQSICMGVEQSWWWDPSHTEGDGVVELDTEA